MALEIKDLTSHSAKVGTFLVRVVEPQILRYSYDRSGVQKMGQRLQCRLVSKDATMYCLATARGDENKLNGLLKKFADQSTWLLTKPQVDAKMDMKWVSAPNKTVVMLDGSTVSTQATTTDGDLATECVPPHNVEAVAALMDKRCIDLMGVLKDVQDAVVQTKVGPRRKLTLTLLDKSDSQACVVQVAVWQDEKSTQMADLLETHKGGVVRLFAVSTDFYNGKLMLSASNSFEVKDGGRHARAEALRTLSNEMKNLPDEQLCSLTGSWEGGGGGSVSVEGNAVLTMCSLLHSLKDSLRQDCLAEASASA